MNFQSSEYDLISIATGTRRPDKDEWTLKFDDEPPSLIRADYKKKKIDIRDDLQGIYRYADWLPVRRTLEGSAAPITYKSEKLATELGLKNLWITFSGWWPEKNALMQTGTFKECEAYSVCARKRDRLPGVLVVASAGNTARAFARVCSDNDIPLLLFVPQDNLPSLWFVRPVSDCVKLLCPEAGGDYFDAIRMSNTLLSNSNAFIAEGGAANIARRDGMGTTVLSAATTAGKIPDVYFQAVGSGTGAIAAWEMAMRLETDGRFGKNAMRLVLSQNEPFIPMADSWKKDSRELLIGDDEHSRQLVSQIDAKVLSNRKPPWAISGGLYDTMKSSRGTFVTASNSQAAQAGQSFAQLEGIDISPAAAVAVASLYKAVDCKLVSKEELIMLNITGGGMETLQSHKTLHHLEPAQILPLDISDKNIALISKRLFV